MALHQSSRILPYSAEQLFRLIADIEHYPEFMPGYQSARIIQGDDKQLKVEQDVGMGPLYYTFISDAILDPPHGLHIQSQDGPFTTMEVDWLLEENRSGCNIRLEIRFELKNRLAERLASQMPAFSAHHLLDRLALRAGQLFNKKRERT